MYTLILLLAAAPPPSCERIGAATGPGEPAIATLLAEVAPGSTALADSDAAPFVITASSQQSWRDKVYRPHNLFDHDYRTAWVENAAGDGIGEWVAVELELPVDREAWGILLVHGFAKNAFMFARNNRPGRLEIELDCAGRLRRCELQPLDHRAAQLFALPEPLAAAGRCRWRLTLRSVVRGTHYRDTSIAEARLMLRPLPAAATGDGAAGSVP